LQVPIAHAEEVEQVFDAISYCKGASVVRMLYAVLGHDDFRSGLQLYMNK
jgi:puromycin-sensitive aminopeptidase